MGDYISESLLGVQSLYLYFLDVDVGFDAVGGGGFRDGVERCVARGCAKDCHFVAVELSCGISVKSEW